MSQYISNLGAAAWSEYDSAAEWCAKRGIKGELGDKLPANMTPAAVQMINNDIEAFQERVRLSAYALACRNQPEF
ncbi:MAG: hypothetical protein KGL39_10090 [Patescibacteria group bacterium]|nr:hypothetical protein [Patescibacteria group bacterium]